MTTPYTDKDEFAISQNYESWDAFEYANPNALLEETLNDQLEDATEIINENIGCFNVNITDERFLNRIKKLNNRMTARMRQIQLGQGLPGKIPMFSPNDFLVDRERKYLQSTVGVVLKFRVIGGVGV